MGIPAQISSHDTAQRESDAGMSLGFLRAAIRRTRIVCTRGNLNITLDLESGITNFSTADATWRSLSAPDPG